MNYPGVLSRRRGVHLTSLGHAKGHFEAYRNCGDATVNGRRIILSLARPRKARIDLWFFRTTGLVLVALALLAGAIALGMTLIRY